VQQQYVETKKERKNVGRKEKALDLAFSVEQGDGGGG